MRTALISLLLGISTSVWATPVVQPVSRQTSSTSIRSRTSSTSSRTHSFQPGTLDDIEFDATHSLGEGGFAKVYKGVSKKTHQPVAVKEMDIKQNAKLHGMSETDIIDFLKTEAKFSHSVHHPNVIQTSELFIPQQGPHKGKAYLLVEYCEKGSLSDFMKKQRSLEQDEAQCYFYQMIQGLHHLHSHHIAHFDIKPANILLNAQGIVKIADMGHARSIPSTGKLLEKNYLGGTERFMAPELLSLAPGSEFLAYQGDIWAAAVTYLHMKGCGDNLWRVARLTDPKYKTYWRDSSQLDFYCQGKLSMAESFVIHRMLNYSPQQRLTMDELIQDPWYQGLASKCH